MIDRIPFIANRLDSHMREVVQGSMVTFIVRCFGIALGFGFNILLARTLGAEGAGVYILAFTIINIASISSRIGLDNTVLRFISANRAVEGWSSVKGTYQTSLKLAGVTTSLVAITIFILAPWLAEYVFSESDLKDPLRWLSVAMVPMASLALQGEALKGLKRIRDSQIVQSVLVRGLAFIGIVLVGSAFGIMGVVWVYVLAAYCTAIIGHIVWHIATPQLRDIAGHFDLGELLQSSMPLFWVTSINLLTNHLSIFVLGIYGTSSEVGIFGAAFRTAMLANIVLVAVNSIAAPKFAALYHTGQISELERTTQNSIKLVILLALPILLMFIVFSQFIMGTFGSEYVIGSNAFVILSLGQFASAMTGTVSYLLMMSGNERVRRNIVFGSAFINVILNFALVPPYGILGAAVATALSGAVQNFIAIFYTHKFLNIKVITLPSLTK